ncbi:MAG: hypothetical protein JNJ49_03855 [Bdellovibrionaceae bacterium]|nr:hypothetical protein [Pseudobdellovibrionaceae bacterium]
MKRMNLKWMTAMFSGVATLVATSTLLIGCADNNNGGAPAAAVVTPAATCQVGQVYNSQYGCLNQQSCQSGYGWVPQQGLCVPGTVSNPTTAGTKFYTSLSITSRDQFALALQTARLCDPYLVGGNLGNASCKNYSERGYLDFQVSTTSANQAYIVIGAGSSSPNIPNSNLTTGGRVLRMEGNVTLNAYNNNLGFIAGTNQAGGIRLVVENGLPASANSFGVVVEYNGVEFARGTLTRY